MGKVERGTHETVMMGHVLFPSPTTKASFTGYNVPKKASRRTRIRCSPVSPLVDLHLDDYNIIAVHHRKRLEAKSRPSDSGLELDLISSEEIFLRPS